jgi:hypothetical protein
MAQNSASADGGSTNKQAAFVQQIDEIVIDPDDVVKHFTKNLRNKNTLYDARSFRICGIRSKSACTVDIGVDPRDDGAYYPDKPHPVWISPRTFVQGWSHDEDDTESESHAIGLPDESENKRIMRDTTPLEEGSDEFEEEHEKSMDDWRQMWDTAVRKDLKDEIEFVFGERVPEMETIRHTVAIRYESDG